MIALQVIGFILLGLVPFRDDLVNSVTFDRRLTFESFGVRISLESDDIGLLSVAHEIAETAFLGKLKLIENTTSDAGYRFGVIRKGDEYQLFQNGKRTNNCKSRSILFKYFRSMLRITVAENAVDRVFVHAGVIGWKGRAVLFPGQSCRGKTTLVKELIKCGAEYFSDEYGVIDNEGFIHPFPRDLSVRNHVYQHDVVDISALDLGATIRRDPARIGSVILTEFKKDAQWKPELLTVGRGILETIPHTIPIKAATEMSLKILNLAFADAIIAKSTRGDVNKDAVAILTFLDKHLN